MSDLGDAQDLAESVDAEVVADDEDDPEGLLQYPAEALVGSRGYGTTAAEERVGEPLEERIHHEIPDPLDAVAEPDEEELEEIESEELYAENTLEDEALEELEA